MWQVSTTTNLLIFTFSNRKSKVDIQFERFFSKQKLSPLYLQYFFASIGYQRLAGELRLSSKACYCLKMKKKGKGNANCKENKISALSVHVFGSRGFV